MNNPTQILSTIITLTLTLTLTLTTGCIMQGRGSKVALGVNAGLLVGGLATVAKSQSNSCRSPPSNTGSGLDDDIIDFGNSIGDGACRGGRAVTTGLGAAMLIAGGIGILATHLLNKADKTEQPVPGAATDLNAYAGKPALVGAAQPERVSALHAQLAGAEAPLTRARAAR